MIGKMTSREIEEYRALRATIRERGTSRVWIFVAGMGLWAAALIAVTDLIAPPVAALLPLLVLAAVFEAVYAVHTGVERVGRYIQVFYEESDPLPSGRWEHAAMAFGRVSPGRGTDPLFATVFLLATACNIAPAVVAGPVPIEWLAIGGGHLLFVARIAVTKQRARVQRAVDLDVFQQIKVRGTK
jgi:hypothetical protein